MPIRWLRDWKYGERFTSPPRERKRIMKIQVKNLDFWYIVATDLAARGIDIEGWVMLSTISIRKIFLSLSIVLAGQDAMVYQASLLLFINQWWFRYPWTRKNGNSFRTESVEKWGYWRYDRDRRANREEKQELDRDDWKSGEEEKKKSNQATRKKSNGQLMKSGEKLSRLKIVRGRAEQAKLTTF